MLAWGEAGGAELVTLELIRRHDRQRVVPVLVFLRDGRLAARMRAAGEQVYIMHARRLRDPGSLLRVVRHLTRVIRRERIDLVHSVMAWAHLHAGLAARLAGVPAVWFQHGVPVPGWSVDAVAARVPAAAILVNSRCTLAGQRRITPSGQPLELIPCGVDVARFSIGDEPAVRTQTRAELGISASTVLFAVIGRIEPGKGHAVFLAAAALVAQSHPDTAFAIAGAAQFGHTPTLPAELRRQAHELGLGERVRFLGHRDDIPALLAATDIAVMPSTRPESFGLAALEAMAAGRPVIASAIGALPELATAGEPAGTSRVPGVPWLVPPGDPTALAEAMRALIAAGAAERQRLGAAGRALVVARFGLEAMVDAVERLAGRLTGFRYHGT